MKELAQIKIILDEGRIKAVVNTFEDYEKLKASLEKSFDEKSIDKIFTRYIKNIELLGKDLSRSVEALGINKAAQGA